MEGVREERNGRGKVGEKKKDSEKGERTKGKGWNSSHIDSRTSGSSLIPLTSIFPHL